MHDHESFAKMWKEVGEMTGTKWRVETTFAEIPETKKEVGQPDEWGDPATRFIYFAVFREE